MNARFLLPLVASALSLQAADWPNFRGPHHDGISLEEKWNTHWRTGEPKVLWKAEVGVGFSSFSVADGRVYTTGNAGNTDTVYCFDAATGKPLWKQSYPSDLGDKFFEGGTSSTPAVDHGHVYQLSRWGDVFCYDAASGKVVWSKNVQQETGADIPDWGFAGSPFVEGESLILNVGESGLALDKATGKLLWKSAEASAGYSTPVPLDRDGRHLMLLASGTSYQAVDTSSGSQLWSFPWPTRYGVNAADPIIHGDLVFISSGYNRGCALLKLASSGPPQVLWQNKELRNQMNASILLDGCLYGIDNDQNTRASLKCLDLNTGAVKWTEPSVGFGSLIAAGGKLLVLTAKGELVVANPSPAKFDVIARSQVLTGKCWTAPVLANGRIYCRNSMGSMVCLDVSG